jgi:hypothetical protein
LRGSEVRKESWRFRERKLTLRSCELLAAGRLCHALFARRETPCDCAHTQHSTCNLYTMAMNTDRRRNNAPSGGTSAPVFARTIREPGYLEKLRPTRSRGANELRRICKYIDLLPGCIRPSFYMMESGMGAVIDAQ